MSDILRGVSLTCGCTNSRISKGQYEVYEFLKKFGAELEYKVQNMSFDVAIPDKKILIEYHGSRYHNNKTRNHEIEKEKRANLLGWKVITVWDYEWNMDREEFKDKLINQCKLNINTNVESVNSTTATV